MKHARAGLRMMAVLIVTAVLYTIWMAGNLVLIASPGNRRHLRRHIVRSWARSLARIIGMRVRVSGSPPVRPFCLVANHLSYVDALLVSGCVDAVFVSRADIRQWPLIGHLAWLSGALFIDRSLSRDVVRINDLIMEAIEREDGVAFFPEGTSTRGIDVGRFRSPLLAFPVERGLPVHYAAISYRTRPPDPSASECVCWWGDMTFVDHVYRMLTLRGFAARIHFGESPVRGDNRKDLARRLRKEVASHFVPVSQTTES